MTAVARLAVAILFALLVGPGASSAATWESVGGGVALGSYSVNAIALDQAGGLYVAGMFEAVCTPPGISPSCTPQLNGSAVGIARWTGSRWEALGTGFSSSGDPYGRALAVGPDGVLRVGGPFDGPGPGTTNFLAAWNGSAWSSYGSGFLPLLIDNTNATVSSIAFGPDGSMYVGGEFTSVDGVAAPRVAKWNGTSWSALGGGLDDRVAALAFGADGTLYAGANVTISGHPTGIAQWNGTGWSGAGQLSGGWASALAVDSRGMVYAGGNFGGFYDGSVSTPADGIARWDGTAWSTLGSGPVSGAWVESIAIDAEDVVYVGFQKPLPNSQWQAQIARWDGAAWTTLASSFGESYSGQLLSVNSLVVDPAGYLYAAGAFASIDGRPTGQIARTIIAVPPGAPTGVTATADATAAEVSWSAPRSNGAGTITGYTVTSQPGGRTCAWTSGPLRCTVSGLERGTTYSFTVTAANIAGTGAASTAAVASTTATTAPRITRLVPARGSVRGGNRVVILGTGLAEATRVTFGGVRARIVRRRSTTLVVIAPERAPGAVAVTVTAGGTRATKRRAYRYVAPTSPVRPAVTG